MGIRYGLLLKRSWNDLKKNLVVFLPYLFSLLLALVFLLIVLIEGAIYYLLNMTPSTNIVGFIILLTIFILIDSIFIVFLWTLQNSMLIGILNAISTKKKATRSDMWLGMRKFTNLNFKLEMIEVSIYLVPLLFLGVLTALGFLVSKTLGMTLVVLFGIIYLLYLITAWAFVAFGWFFIYPILSIDKLNSPIKLIKYSLKYSKENLGHVVISWAITAGIGLVMNVVYQSGVFAVSFPSLDFLFFPVVVIISIFSIIIYTWIRIFTFNAYFNKDMKKL